MAEISDPPAAKRRDVSTPTLLTASHHLSGFDCGDPALNDWLKRRATESEGKTARTFVACEGKTIVGYYCLAAGSVDRSELPKPLRKHGLPKAIPVIIIGRLARDLTYKASGLGRDLLQDALRRIVTASATIGIRCVLVHAIDEQAAKFWTDHEFIESPMGSRTFFMPIETIMDSLSD